MAPFIAAKAAGPENFKWMMFGDDDTVFFVDNVLQVCAQELVWQGCCYDLCSLHASHSCNTLLPIATAETC